MTFNAKTHRKNGQQTKFGWLVEHKSFSGDECLIWPFSRNREGYGQLGVGDGLVRKANRVMCELVHGEPPEGFVAAHSCGNGHLGCVHPKHVSWKTQSENEADKRTHGTVGIGRGNRTDLTPAQVAHIRASKGKITAAKLGEQYGLKRAGVRYWQETSHDPVPRISKPTTERT